MKKLFTILILMLGLSAFAEDSYLYWMISGADSLTWDTAVLNYVIGDTKTALTIYDWYNSDDQWEYGESLSREDYDEALEIAQGADEDANATFYAYLTGIDGIESFVLELYSSDELVKSSDSLSYADALDYIQYADNMATPIEPPYGFVVPEPTSGLLVLIGGALLSLRRKRKLVV